MEAGLDQTKFEPSEPNRRPPFDVDERTAWKGTLADWADIPIRIEAASFEGKPVYFQVVYPWEDAPQQASATNTRWQPILLNVITTILFIGIIVLVWHNIKNGRADLRGTAKFGLFFMVLGIVLNLFNFDHFFTSIQEFNVLTEILRRNLFVSLFLGLVYCAFEPFVRRWWSEYLISWSRLLAGDFRDPMVGRDILIGGVGACVVHLFFLIIGSAWQSSSGENRGINILLFYGGADSFPDAIADVFVVLSFVVPIGLGFMGSFLLVYFVTRNKMATFILSGIVFTAYWVIDAGVAARLVMVFSVSVSMIIFNRFGIVAFIACWYFSLSFSVLLLSFDPVSIVFPSTVATLVIFFAITGYAAYNSIGGAKMFGGKSWLGD